MSIGSVSFQRIGENPEISIGDQESGSAMTESDFYFKRDDQDYFIPSQQTGFDRFSVSRSRETDESFFLQALTEDDGWNEFSREGDVVVSSKMVIAENGHSYMAYKGEMYNVAGLTIEQMLEATWDKESQVGVISHLERVENLYETPSVKVIYQVINFGSVAAKRHNILKYEILEKSPTHIKISWESIPLKEWGEDPDLLLEESAVEPPVNQGYIEFNLETKTLTKVFLFDAEARVPGFLINRWTLSDMPANLKEFLDYALTK